MDSSSNDFRMNGSVDKLCRGSGRLAAPFGIARIKPKLWAEENVHVCCGVVYAVARAELRLGILKQARKQSNSTSPALSLLPIIGAGWGLQLVLADICCWVIGGEFAQKLTATSQITGNQNYPCSYEFDFHLFMLMSVPCL